MEQATSAEIAAAEKAATEAERTRIIEILNISKQFMRVRNPIAVDIIDNLIDQINDED